MGLVYRSQQLTCVLCSHSEQPAEHQNIRVKDSPMAHHQHPTGERSFPRLVPPSVVPHGAHVFARSRPGLTRVPSPASGRPPIWSGPWESDQTVDVGEMSDDQGAMEWEDRKAFVKVNQCQMMVSGVQVDIP